jgi:peptide deformylase
MPLKIAQLGQPILRRVAEPVPAAEVGTPEFQQFLADMNETLEAAGGVGLAGPQVFSGRRVFLAKILPPAQEGDRPGMEVFINPHLTAMTDEVVAAWEGCLSFSELLVLVPRLRAVRVDYLDATGQPKALALEGFPARVVQHEFDHLEGVLTIDRAESTLDIIKASEIDAVLGEPDDADTAG